MAQGGIKKGFFFYFGLFILLLISAFLICLVIMMFNPGKTVLWMQYFTADSEVHYTKTTDGSAINYASITKIEIEATYANVTVQKNAEYEAKQEGLIIINKAKGFASAKQAVHYNVNIAQSGSTLKVKVTEPTGFLYFSKNIEIILAANDETGTNWSNVDLVVKTTDGDIEIGGTKHLKAKTVYLKSLDLSATGKGDIDLQQMLDVSNANNLKLSTNKGDINSDIAVGSELGIVSNCNTILETNSGVIKMDTLTVASGRELHILCKAGDVKIDKISADVVAVSCVQGNYVFGTITGNLSYTNSEDTIISPNILVTKLVSGDFTLTTDGNSNANPDVEIKEVGGDITVIADKGHLEVAKAHGAVSVNSKDNLYVGIIFADTSANHAVTINNVKGDVDLGFQGSKTGTVEVVTNGDIEIKVTSAAKFISEALVNNDSGDRVADSKISVSTNLSDGRVKNPLDVKGTSANSWAMTLKTNGKIKYTLVEASALA